MKKFLSPSLVIVGFLFLVLGASSASAQKVGGFKAVDPTSDDVTAAASFAISTQTEKSGTEFELVRVAKAEKQVVAGTNYRLCLDVSDGDNRYTVTAVVYMDLKKVYKLTSWVNAECGAEE